MKIYSDQICYVSVPTLFPLTMKGVTIQSYVDPSSWLIATLIQGHGRNEFQLLALRDEYKPLESKITFQSDEQVLCGRWIQQDKKKVSKKRSSSDEEKKQLDFYYLAILLATGEILVYSPETKEFVSKMSNESPLSCICYGGISSTILGYDPKDSTVKRYNMFDSRPLETYQIKELGKNINFMQTLNDGEIGFASDDFCVYNDTDRQYMYAVEAPKNHHRQIIQVIGSKKHPQVFAASRFNDQTISMISVSDGRIADVLRCKGHVISITISESGPKDEILIAVTDKGRAELFKNPFDQHSRKQIQCDMAIDVGKDSELNCVVKAGSSYQAIYFDGYKIKVEKLPTFRFRKGAVIPAELGTEFEEKRETQKQDIPVIDLDDDDDGKAEEEKTEETKPEKAEPEKAEPAKEEKKEPETQETEQDSMGDFGEEIEPETSSPHALYEKVVANIDNRDELKTLITQDPILTKQMTYLLSETEANQLFKQLAVLLCEGSGDSQLTGYIRWILILRGSYIIRDVDSLELLKLLKSTTTQNAHLLPHLLGLQGRLSLLNSQLKMRSEAMTENAEAESSEDLDEDEDISQFKDATEVPVK